MTAFDRSRIVAAALAAALMAGPCIPRAAAAAQERSPSEDSAVTVTPAHISTAVASLDGLAEALMRKTGIPGMAIAVVYDDKVVYAKGFGVRRLGTHERVDANTVFQLASVSKSLASAVVAGVVGQGKVRWSDPVAKYLPGFTLADPWVGSHVTIADMFSHRSGLPDHAGDILEDLGYTRAQIISRLALEPLKPFRITYEYTNFGLTAAAQAVADAEGTTWEALSQRVLYGPLGMTSTSSRWADYNARADRAVPYVKVGGAWKASVREPDAQSPAGGASSSVRDLAQWMRLELDEGAFNGKQIIDKSALLETQRPQIVTGSPDTTSARASFYGLGVGVGYDAAGRVHLTHSGAFALGAATAYDLLPSEKLGIVVLTNAQPMGVPEALTKEFYDLVEYGKIQRDWYQGYSGAFAKMLADHGELVGKKPPEHPAPAQPAAVYAGTYANAYYGPAIVEAKGAALTLIVGPKRRSYALEHWNGNTFAFTPAGESSTGLTAVTFVPASGDKAATMTVESFDDSGLGTFTKTPAPPGT